MPKWQLKGLLQSLWDFTSENAEPGDIGRHTNAQIALGIGCTEKEIERFLGALIKTRWIDCSERHRLVVHDWHEHCEEWVKKRVKRAEAQWASMENTVDAYDLLQQMADNVRQRQTTADNGGQRRAGCDGSLPSVCNGRNPVCLPGPGPEPESKPGPDPARTRVRDGPSPVDTLYEATGIRKPFRNE